MASIDNDALVVDIRRLGKASTCLDPVDQRRVALLCEAGKLELRTSTQRAVVRSEGGTMLKWGGADGTPVQVSAQCREELLDKTLIRRSGKTCHEFLVAAEITRSTDARDTCTDTISMRDPVPLTKGTTVDRIFESIRTQWATLRQHGHRGGAVEGYTFDRKGWAAMARRTKQWHRMLSPGWADPKVSSFALWLLEFVVVLACAAHDAQNALKWSTKAEFDSSELLRGAYLGIESIRNSFDVILIYLSSWIVQSLTFATPWSDEERSLWASLWQVLGVAPGTIALLLGMELRVSDGILIVSETWCGEIDLAHRIYTTLLAVWKFKKFSDSRWLTVGAAARVMIAAHFTGVKSFLFSVKGKPGVGSYYLHGFWDMPVSVWEFLVVVSIVAQVPDVAMAQLLKDNRLALHVDVVKEKMGAAIQSITEFDQCLWMLLATVCGLCWRDLRQKVATGCHRAYAFFQFRVLDIACDLPWSLLRGDIAQNLRDLASRAEPKDETSWKLWKLMKQGHPMSVLVRLVRLLGDIPWTTAIIEQLHAHAAITARFHPEYGLAMLLAKTLVSVLCKILPSLSSEENTVQRTERQLEAMDRKDPKKSGGHQEYFKDLAVESRSRGATMTAAGRKQLMQRIMRKHGKLWKDKSCDFQQRYSLAARVQALQKEHDNREKRAVVVGALLRQREDVLEAQKSRAPLSFRGCKWGGRELESVSAIMQDAEFKRVKVAEKRARACVAPDVMSDKLVQSLEEQDIWVEDVPSEPPWLSDVANRRDHFEGVAFVVDAPGFHRLWKFVFAMQQPMHIRIAQMVEVDGHLPTIDDETSFECARALWKTFYFDVTYTDNKPVSILSAVPVSSIRVIDGLEFEGGRRWSSDGVPQDLRDFILRNPPTAKTKAERKSGGKRKPKEFEPKRAWAEQVALNKRRREKQSAPEPVPASDSSSYADDCCEEDDARLDKRWEECEQLRLEWSTHPDMRYDDFGVLVLQAQKNVARKGVREDAIRAYARSDRVKDWCRTQSLKITARWEIDFYGVNDANVLAMSWAAKMQHFYNLCASKGVGVSALSDHDRRSWHEPIDFSRLAERYTDNRQAMRRVCEVRALFS